ncbi:HlyC/CorC family transporter [Methylorubrum sp. POS3]|uniref:HlyC/CorC family transporter n=1 Tax=Methylorubrum sp. POS3 TaxID=2998492 RepID=UPI00372C4C78
MDDHTEFWFAAGIVGIALILSAFFAGAETAFTAASRARILALENAGSRQAGIVNRILAGRERFIGAMLIGYNVVAIGAAAFTTGVLVHLFGKVGVLYATAALSVLVIAFAQVLPKTLAINNPDRIALASARPVAFAVGLLGPLALAVEALVRILLRPFGLSIDAGRSILTPTEEIRGQVALLHREGGVEKAQRDMLGGLLDLGELTVAEVMVHRTKMRTIDAGLSSEEIVRAVLASPYTRMPLWRDSHENIVGVLHAKDLLRALDAAGGVAAGLKVEALALETWFVPDTTTLRDQLKAFLNRKTHFALVVDEYGEVMGLVTLEDILEEIVGDIADEHDVAVSGVRPQADGSVLAEGSVAVRDLNRAMDWNLPDAEATTVAGLVIHEARAIPDAGTAFNFHGFRFQVLRKARNRITSLRITRLTPIPAARREA